MNTRRLRLVRPKWTLGTMLLVVGWSAVVVWLNVRPTICIGYYRSVFYYAIYGYPWNYASAPSYYASRPGIHTADIDSYPALAANLAIGLLAVGLLTFASKSLVRAIVAGLRAFVGKPPPSKEEGPSKSL